MKCPRCGGELAEDVVYSNHGFATRRTTRYFCDACGEYDVASTDESLAESVAGDLKPMIERLEKHCGNLLQQQDELRCEIDTAWNDIWLLRSMLDRVVKR